jgi:FlaA1/EpsC-like NDP-sugar epimerase
VFHAAAYKHVPLMQDSPQEAIRTNVLGTYNVAKLSQDYRVKKMVLVSTDKAVRSTNVMGATKYYAETIVRHFAKQKMGTSYAAVRFGNVLASNGSVIPLFKKQIELGGPVTVTDPNITRFFMTIPEAVGLILQCGVYAQDGEIFVLDMGKPVKILDLAEKMIRQSGYMPHQEIKIEFTGLRPGEKMYEELLLDPKTTIKTKNEKIFIDRTEQIGFNEVGYERLLKLAMSNSSSVITELFQQLNLKG